MVISIEERQLRRPSLAKGFTNSIDSFEQQLVPNSTAPSDKDLDVYSGEDEMVSLFYKLKHALEKEMIQWWNILLLQKYLDVHKIPRGLRITKLCNFLEDNLNTEWIDELRKCNRMWLSLIVKH